MLGLCFGCVFDMTFIASWRPSRRPLRVRVSQAGTWHANRTGSGRRVTPRRRQASLKLLVTQPKAGLGPAAERAAADSAAAPRRGRGRGGERPRARARAARPHVTTRTGTPRRSRSCFGLGRCSSEVTVVVTTRSPAAMDRNCTAAPQPGQGARAPCP